MLILSVLPERSVRSEVPPIIGIIPADTNYVLFGFDLATLRNQGTNHSNLLAGNGRFGVYLYRGGISFDTLPFLKFDSTNSNNMNDVGDVNGDGHDDFALLGRSSFGWKFNLYYGGHLADTIRDRWFGLDSFTARSPAWVWDNMKGNGVRYLVTGSTSISSFFEPQLLIFNLGGPFDSVPEYLLRPIGVPPIESGEFGRDFAVGDFNGDGIRDLAVGMPMNSRSGEVWVYYGGLHFDTLPNVVIRRPGVYEPDYRYFGTNVECPGDLDRDGYDDLKVGGSGSDTTGFVYLGRTLDTVPDIMFSPSPEIIHSAGDVSGDGYPDFIVATPLPFSSGNRVMIYDGGPTMDGTPDLIIQDWEIPGYHTHFGAGCTGIGDFNGDGIDDFAFTLRDNDHRDFIYIFAGTKSTEVPLSHEPNLPTGFELHQNYPNPFNGSTRIQFAIPHRSRVHLSIRNIEGRVVETLVDRELSVGTYTADVKADRLASGVYFCILEVGQTKLTTKMVLIK